MMHRLKQVRPSLLGLGLTAATSMGIGLGLSSICDDQSGMGKYYLNSKFLSLERDLKDIKTNLGITDTYGDGDNPTKDIRTGLPLTKLALANGKYFIRSEAPWQGYLQGKLCSISDDATKKSLSALFDVTDVNGSAGFVSLRSSFFDGRYLAVQKGESDVTSAEEEENYKGPLFLLKDNDKSSSLEAAQFELLVPLNTDNVAFFWKKAFWKKKEEGIRVIIRSVSNQRFVSIKSGGNPFATEKDPALATVFFLESMNSFLSPRGIYHIQVGTSSGKHLVEDETSDELIKTDKSSRKGLFRLSHNDDGTISLFSLTLNKYVRLSSRSSRIGFYDGGEIAKFEVRQLENPSDGAVQLLVASKFLGVGFSNVYLFDEEKYANLFEFLPVKS